MHDLNPSGRRSWINRPRNLVLVIMLIAGAGVTWWTIRQADIYLREALVSQARFVAQAMDIKRIRTISGLAADRPQADHLRLKDQLAATRTLIPGCESIYLMGRRENGDLFLFGDSNPVGVEKEAPTGQRYMVDSAGIRHGFEASAARAAGPFRDSRGRWIRAEVPLTDPDTGSPVAILGMNFAAGDWQWKRLRTALPVMLLTLVAGVTLIAGTRGSRNRPAPDASSLFARPLRENLLAIILMGSFLSLSAAWLTGTQLIQAHRDSFWHLVEDKTAIIDKTLQTVQHIELESLARLFEASEYVSIKEFDDYTDYLVKDPVIRTWAWAQWIPAPDRDATVERLRAGEIPEFSIWQWDAQGNPVVVKGLESDSYPILRAAPPERRRECLGLDLGAEPLQQKALETAARSRLTTCTAPVGMPHQADRNASIQVYRPVFASDGTDRLRGFATAELDPAALLEGERFTDTVRLELSMGIDGTAIVPLAVSSPMHPSPNGRYSITCPFFAFGRAFLVTAQAGDAFVRFYPAHTAFLVMTAGLMLTALLGGWFGSVHRKREQLEVLVDERTRDLIETRHQVELALHGADLGTWDWRVPTDTMTVNANWARMLGYRLDEIKPLLTDWRTLIVPEDRAAVAQAMDQHLGDRSAFYEIEHRLQHKAGHHVWVLAKGRVLERDADGTPLRVCGTCLDTTRHRQVKAALKTSEMHLRTLIDTLPDLVWLKDPNGVFLSCNKRFERLYGAKEADIIGKTDYDFVDHDLADFFREKDQAAIAAGKACVNEEEISFADDGHREILETIKTPMVDARGNIIGVLGISRNISERKQAEEQLRLSEEKFSKVFTMAPNFITITRLEDGLIADVNIGFEEISGWTRGEVVGRRAHDIGFWVDPSARTAMVEALLAGEDVSHREMKFRCKDGTVRLGVYSARLISISGERHMIFVMQDITDSRQLAEEHRQLQQQLHQAQKLEAIGILAGGVAHDFNNMLGAIMGYAELAKARMDDSDPLRRPFDKILEVARRSADLTRQLLAFARKQTVNPVAFELNAAVDGTLKMLCRLIGEDIELVWSPAKTAVTVCMDPTQLDQILANLCVNARDAITDVGTVTIAVEPVDFDETASTHYADCIPGEYVRLAVADNGCGMDPETQDHVFEPFFTTKELGKGTGLGLATVYGIVKQNEGFIRLYSEPGIGTTFNIYLPRQAVGPDAEAAADKTAIPYGHGETVLMVEDDPTMREMGRLMLQRLGYTVIVAALPGEAVRLVEEETADIQMVITDVIMPEMNGRELADRLLAIRPRMKRMFMSGYPADVIADRGVMEEGVHFIQKPFSLKDLGEKIRAVLEGRTPEAGR